MEVINKDITIIIDNGHGNNTPGKCSPDKRLLEYRWNREIADGIIKGLSAIGLKAVKLVPEENDISLSTRVNRANKIYSETNKKAILVSIHVNAAGNGGWHNATGWSVYISPNASLKSKKLAQSLYECAYLAGLKGNRSVPNEKYWVSNLYICKNTNCPAVLTENLFMDNKSDLEYLLSNEGKETII